MSIEEKFSSGQRFGLKQMRKGSNVFLTGKAGSGKSTVIEAFKENAKGLVVLAPTGVAAVNVGGATVHSFFNLKPFYQNPLKLWEKYVAEVAKEENERDEDMQKVIDAVRKIKSMVFDEFGMLRADVLGCVDCICRAVKGKVDEPFGGIQVIGCGDVFQLPPVLTKSDYRFIRKGEEWFFHSPGFKQGHFKVIELDVLHRVAGEGQEKFKDALNNIRVGLARAADLEYLNKRVQKAAKNSLVLTSTNKRAFEINKERLEALKGKWVTYDADVDLEDGYKLEDQEFQVESKLWLKRGARVMLITNNRDGGWWNGTTGVYIGKVRAKDILIIRKDNGEEVFVPRHTFENKEYIKNEKGDIDLMTVASMEQYPIKIAYAMTIHKGQGKTLNKVHLDLGETGAFAHGQAYVGLSRVTSYEGLTLEKPLTQDDIICDGFIKQFMEEYLAA